MNGTLAVSQRNETLELPWAGRRNKAEATGTWEWTGPGETAVRLKIERRHGQLSATYIDAEQVVPVRDFYDFGGGFYFTLPLGLQGSSYVARPPMPSGWMIGEGIATNNAITGIIAFYPHPEPAFGPGFPARPQPAGEKTAPREGRQEWRPKRVSE